MANYHQLWNPCAGENGKNPVRRGYFTEEYARRHQLDFAEDYGSESNYKAPGPAGYAVAQQQQTQIYQDQSRHSGVFSSSSVYGHWERPQTNHYIQSYYSERPENSHYSQDYYWETPPANYYSQSYYSGDYNCNYYPPAKRNCWDPFADGTQVAPPEKRIRCYDCGRFFHAYSALYKHKDEEHKRSFYCSTCNKEFPSHALMKKHETSHTMNVCPKCPETFKYKDSLAAHMKHAHPTKGICSMPGIPEDSGTEADQAVPPANSSAAEAEGSGDKGEMKFFNNPAASSTPITEKKNQTETPDTSDSVKTEPFGCPHCIKSFDSEDKMLSHCRIHTEAAPDGSSDVKSSNTSVDSTLSCPLCIKKFAARRDLFVHMSSAHTQIFYCPKCPAEFPSQNELAAHKQEHE